MDESRLKMGMVLAVVAALFFLFFVVKRFLGVMQFSLKAILCLVAVAALTAAIWSRRLPPQDEIEPAPAYQAQHSLHDAR